jgi:hypothetical protein
MVAFTIQQVSNAKKAIHVDIYVHIVSPLSRNDHKSPVS